jgi:formylglycine-generating enzyme required for sulfatase activity
VRISRFVEQGPLLVEEPTGELVKTPAAIELAPGSYVLDITHPERPPIRATVLLGSGERLTRDVWIPAEGVVADGFCYVPGGEYWIGGDELAPGFAPREKVTIAPFALGRLLVTVGQYAEFLNHLMKDEAPARAAGHAPAVASSAYWVPHRGEYPVPFVDPDGDTWLSDMPIIMMKATDADAFAEWSNRRLPRSAEWEIAVSGGDGRAFPWGNGFDAACSWMVDSCAGLGPRPVGTRPLDRSIFGVMDAAGLAREWMAPEPTYELRIVRGGAFQATANQCRIGRKNLAGPGVAYVTFGIRLAQDLDLVFRSEARRYPLGRE